MSAAPLPAAPGRVDTLTTAYAVRATEAFPGLRPKEAEEIGAVLYRAQRRALTEVRRTISTRRRDDG